MAMDLLGPSLADLHYFCSKKFSLKTTMMIASQLFSRVQVMHDKNYIHRDIKPENFAVGLTQKSHTIHIIDMGLA